MGEADEHGLTRRQGFLAVLGGATSAIVAGCSTDGERSVVEGDAVTHDPSRMPVVYLPHGGGPWPFVEMSFGDKAELAALAGYLRGLQAVPPTKPKAVLMISAHWEAPVPTVMTSEKPPLLFDYYGFPKASYELTWPAPGDPALAARVRSLLETAGIATAEDAERGFDHGTFVPLKLTYPEADVPTVQLSLKAGLDPAEHLAIGRALAPLRDEGVFIVGSGMSYHNMRGFGPSGVAASEAFDGWLGEAMRSEPKARAALLAEWSSAPSARAAHPREEHLLPLMVIVGAALDAAAKHTFSGSFASVRLSGYQLG